MIDALRQSHSTAGTPSASVPDEVVAEVFVAAREMAFRLFGLRPYDVQFLGGLALHYGNTAEMATGEGKTLVASVPVILNALFACSLGPVLAVTVNDYLARRDLQLLVPLYRFFGLSGGLVQAGLEADERRAMYACDVVHITNSELGFDYRRDKLLMRSGDAELRGLGFAVVDEVGSILIDDAETPLIISAPAGDNTLLRKYDLSNRVAGALTRGDHYTVDDQEQAIALTEAGYAACESLLKVPDLFDPRDAWARFIINAFKAKELFDRDVHYIVRGEAVQIVDESTGRVLKRRRWSSGMHQAVEAKEAVPVRAQASTSAKVTYHALFQLFAKLSGMTGTAATTADEFKEIYGLDVITIPTALPSGRKDYRDVVFKNASRKFIGIMREIARVAPAGGPSLSPRNVRKEAEIVAQAGRKFSITIYTNMAGRGTDILLGGNAAYFARALARRELLLLNDNILQQVRAEDAEDDTEDEQDLEVEVGKEEDTAKVDDEKAANGSEIEGDGENEYDIVIRDGELPIDISDDLMAELRDAVADLCAERATSARGSR